MHESESTLEQARSHVQDAAGQAGEKVKETAAEAKSKAGEGLREQVDGRSTQAGEQVTSVAQALRRTGGQLRDENQELPARALERSADTAERLGSYLRESSADELLHGIEDFARRQPWLVAAGAFAAGLLGSRFLKASSTSRYQQGDGRPAVGTARRPYAALDAPSTTYEPPAMPVDDRPREGF